ncbi:MAG: NAD(P)/FAD-dependent oxidoreductase [Chloroflexota bacterium]
MRVAIVGGGMTGLSAAEQLTARGIACTVYERDDTLGGLAGSFTVGGTYLEKFYHHLFTSDTAMAELVARVGLGDKLQWLPTSNSYYAGRFYRLSTPMDLLRFSYISLLDRLRLGLLYLRTRFVKDWRPLEEITAREWLVDMAGERVYQAVWQPLLRSKFGQYADQVAAVWMWNKLKLRGSSRGKGQEERLGYVVGGFGQVVDALVARLRGLGVALRTGAAVERVVIEEGVAKGVIVGGQRTDYDAVLVTTAPAILAQLAPDLPADYRRRLESIHYLANVCLVMALDRSLSSTYWLNVGDPTIPFTGVIEHTNMQRRELYGGAHLAYISRYLDADDPFYALSADAILDAYLPHLQRMFRGFERAWVRQAWAWRERYTQPVIGLRYTELKPPFQTPARGLWLCSMAQVYPEDRGMNYAVAYGQRVVEEMLPTLGAHP